MHDLTVIGNNIRMELTRSKVVTPPNYSLENAMKSAYLILVETVDRNKQPVLNVCSPESIHRALLDMAVQGLNPAKKQCYFIAYGKSLQMQRSYMGSQAVAKRVCPAIADIRAEVIYEGDHLTSTIVNAKRVFGPHQQDFGAIQKNAIIGAYAVAVDEKENQMFTELMTIDEIKQSWKQSKMQTVTASGAINADSTHGKFSAEMAKKTVINRLCKKIINTSDDATLLESVDKTDEEADPIQVEINANQARIPMDFAAPQSPPAASQPEEKPAPVENPFCTMEQRRRIIELENAANRGKDESIANMRGFLGREINSTKELLADEAASYIEMLESEISPADDSEQAPPWGAE